MAKPSRKISRGEKQLFLAICLSIVLLLGFGAWHNYANAIPDVDIPTPKMPSPNAFDFYVKAGNAIIPATPAVDALYDTEVVPKPQWKSRYPTAKKESWLQKNATALKLLRQGFQFSCRVPPQHSRNPSLFLSSTKNFRSSARMLSVESHTRSERGNWSGAAESALDIMRLGRDVSQGGALMDFLSSAPIGAHGRRDLWEILPQLNNTKTKAKARKFERLIRTRVPYADVLREEKYYGQTWLLNAMRSRQWILVAPAKATVLVPLNMICRSITTSRRTVFNNYTDYMDALIAAAQKPYAAQANLPAVPDDIISQRSAPLFERGRWSYARHETGNALLLVALALHAYRLEHQSYPQTLNQLVPHYLKAIPTDPFGSGELLHYKLSGAKYSLYSIGPDGIDNGGRAIENTKVSKEKRKRFLVQFESKGDAVAGINK